MRPIISSYSVSTAFRANNVAKQSFGQKKDENGKVAKTVGLVSLVGLAGLSAYGIAIVHRKPPQKTFETLLKENELIFKDNTLFDKTGKKFSGTLSRSTGEKGETGFEMIETQVFNDGIIEEKIYKDCFNNELKGTFYKEGKVVSDVAVVSNMRKKGFSFAKYKEDGSIEAMGHGLAKRKDSVFDLFRNNKGFEQ